jgi:hypothetical protein
MLYTFLFTQEQLMHLDNHTRSSCDIALIMPVLTEDGRDLYVTLIDSTPNMATWISLL